MTPEQELELLVEEQAADDASQFVVKRGGEISLDAPGGERIGRDPWDLVDALIDAGVDPAEVAYRGVLVDEGTKPELVDPRDIPHGTAGGYQNHKCKCEPCTTAWATYKRERRAARRAAA